MTWTTSKHRAARERANAATPGPWVADVREIVQHSMGPLGTGPLSYYTGCATVVGAGYTDGDPVGVQRDEDRAFIAHARTDLPEALDAIEERDRLLRRVLDFMPLNAIALPFEREIRAVLEGREQG